jgi:hypothetical protein
MDTTILFGLRSPPKIFTALVDAVEWIARNEGVKSIIHYTWTIFWSSGPRCHTSVHRYCPSCKHLGLPVAIQKLGEPTTCLEFLGFKADSVATPTKVAGSAAQTAARMGREEGMHTPGFGICGGKTLPHSTSGGTTLWAK